jgi:hypothetical protein
MKRCELSRWLSRRQGDLVFLLDADALQDAVGLAARIGPWARVANLPEGVSDPGDLQEGHQELLKEQLDGAASALDCLCTAVRSSAGQDRTAALENLFTRIAHWQLDTYDADTVRDHVTRTLKSCGVNQGKYKAFLAEAQRHLAKATTSSPESFAEAQPVPARMACTFGSDCAFWAVPCAVQADERWLYQWSAITSEKTLVPITDGTLKLGSEIFMIPQGAEGLTPMFMDRLTPEDVRRVLEQPPPTASNLLGSVLGVLARHIYVSDDTVLTLLAVWTIGAYVFRLFSTYAYLHLHGPSGSAKSKVLDVVFQLAPLPQLTASMSVSSLFRSVEAVGGCVLIDEAEGLRRRTKDNEELFAVLNQGYRSQGYAVRVEKRDEDFTPRAFSVFSPKMLHIRADIYAYCLAHWKEIRRLYEQEASIQLGGRLGQLWAPLLAVALCLDDDGVGGTADSLRKWARQQREDEHLSELDVAVLSALRDLVEASASKELTVRPKDVLEKIKGQERDELDLEDEAKACVAIGRTLKRFGFKRKRDGRGSRYTVGHEELVVVESAYLPDEEEEDGGEGPDPLRVDAREKAPATG